MTYAVNQLIRVGDFNSFAGASGTSAYGSEPASASLAGGASLGLLYGPGYGSWGYNQSAISLTTVSTSNQIQTGPWTNLRNILAAVRTHQTGAVDSLVPPTGVLVAGHLVDAHESSPPTSDPYDFNSVIDLALGNRFTLASGTLITLGTVTRATSWGAGVGTIQSVFRTTWADANAAGFFFNTGGYVRLTFSQPVTTIQDSDWSDAFVNRIGQIRVGAKTTINTGSVSIPTAIGFYNLTGSYQTVWSGSGANGFVNAHYNSNSVQVEALVGGAALNGRPGAYIDFRITLSDPSHNAPDGVSLGTAMAVSVVKDTTNLTTVPATPGYSLTSGF